jgi:tRNA A-37 threonylcarbamoyl transferase component Bud32
VNRESQFDQTITPSDEAPDSMAFDARLDALLERWEELQEEGIEASPEELCSNCPELLDEFKRRIEALRQMDHKLKTHHGTEMKTLPFSAEDAAEPPATSGLSVYTRYAGLRYHARGGLGVVYAAHDQHLRREVAVKYIRTSYAHLAESRNRFLTEAEITGRLDHPGVVPVYGFGEDERGRLFYVMRFIHGETLDDAIAKFHSLDHGRSHGPALVEFRNLLMRFVSVCNTIAYAHNRGIVHRDIKPENVMLGRYGETLVVDWGLAMPVERDQQARQSGEGTLMPSLSDQSDSRDSGGGTPAYMSPEQADDEASVSPASDVYSLGATLYKILTGQPPIQGRHVGAMLRRVRTGEFPRPSAVKSDVSRPLEAICLKAMSLNPQDRYPTPVALAQDVERWLADEEVSAYDEPFSRRMARWGRRHRTAAQSGLLALATVMLVVAGAAVWLWSMAQREAEAHLAAENARRRGLQVSAKFAARTIASEIDLRWRILGAEADDPELRTMLAKINETPDDRSLWTPLQAWLDARFIEHNPTARAESWFINSRTGIQVARTPVGESIGRSYAHRDYFHGQGRELTPDEAAGVEPLARENISAPYVSTSTGNFKVAFSLPIWSGRVGSPERQVLGVLAMAVDLGEFAALQTGLNGGQTALLIDLREDQLGDQPQRGLVIHHPRLQQAAAADAPLRLRPDLVEFLRDRSQARSGSGDNLIPGYTDSAQATPAPMLAAFESVRIHGRSPDVADTGWVIVVQEPAEAQ